SYPRLKAWESRAADAPDSRCTLVRRRRLIDVVNADDTRVKQQHVRIRRGAVASVGRQYIDRFVGLLIWELIDRAAQLALLNQVERGLQRIEADNCELAWIQPARLDCLYRTGDHIVVCREHALEAGVVGCRANAGQD